MIRLKKLKYKNFFSTGNSFIEFDFTKNEKVLITGHNGSGKSTFVNAVCYALYGKPYKEVLKNSIINSVNKKNMHVEIEFDIGSDNYIIKRGLKPTLFEIHKNGTLVDQEAKSKDYQAIIEKEILKNNYNAFKQIFVIGNSGFTPFMKLDASRRREMIENILDLNVFTLMNIQLKTQISDCKSRINEITLEIDKKKFSIKSLKENLQFVTSEAQSSKSEKIQSLDIEIAEIEGKLSKIPDNLPDFSAKKMEQSNMVFEMQKSIADVSSKLTSFLKNKLLLETDKCPTCQQTIDSYFKKTRMDTLENDILEFENQKNEKEKELLILTESVRNMEEKINQKNKVLILKEALLSKKTKLLEDRHKIVMRDVDKSKIDDLTKRISDISELLDLDEKESSSKKNQLQIQNYGLMLLKDNGIKSKIINSFIPLINQLINQYLDLMNFNASFEINENFEESIKSRYRDIFSYDNFSDGEKARIDLAFLFTWRTIAKMRNSMSCNILILDEVFSGSLDGEGVEDLTKILASLIDTNIYIISHRNDNMVDKFDKVLKFSKDGNFTKIEEIQ